MNAAAWSRGLEVTGGGTGVVSHAGLDRGRVFADLACAIADGARVISDFRVMGDQGEVFGQVASVPTAWRALKETAADGTAPGAGSPPQSARPAGTPGPRSRPGTGSCRRCRSRTGT